MNSLEERIVREGNVLGTPNLEISSAKEFRGLKRKLSKGESLVAIYGNDELGNSISPIESPDDVRIIRNMLRKPLKNRPGASCTYYAIPEGIINN
jgi:hypothetical protein